MGCSSSALNKAGDSSRSRSGVPSNENSSTVEQSNFCVAQPKPCVPGKEAAFPGSAHRESLPPLERPTASVMPTANGVKSYHQSALANDETPGKPATDQSEPAKKMEPLLQGEESERPQPGGKDDAAGTEEMKKDRERRTEAPSVRGDTESEPLGAEARSQPLGTSGESSSPGTGEGTEIPHTAGEMKLLETAENILPLETAEEPLPEEAMGKDPQPRVLDAVPKENNSPEIAEGCQFVENGEQKELQETLREDKQSQLLEIIPKENNSSEIAEGSQSAENREEQQPRETPGKEEQLQLPETVPKEKETPQMPDRSQLAQTPVTNESFSETPDRSRNASEFQPEAEIAGVVGEQLPSTAEAAANVKMARETNSDTEQQHIEGETGEKVEAEKKTEKESEDAETKEKETGEAMDPAAAEDGDGRAGSNCAL